MRTLHCFHLRRSHHLLSSVRGPTHPPLVESTLPAYYENVLLSRFASRPALICRRELPRAHGGQLFNKSGVNLNRSDCLAWDYSELHEHVKATARGLLNLGVNKGDRVGVLMGNNSAYACLQWACASIGAILVTINPAYRPRELLATLQLVGVSTLVYVPRIRSSLYSSVLAEAMPSLLDNSSSSKRLSIPELPSLRNLILVRNSGSSDSDSEVDKTSGETDLSHHIIDFRDMLIWSSFSKENNLFEKVLLSLQKDDIINLQFTSGTTGVPKAVSLTHYNLLNNGLAIGRSMRITEKDSLCLVLGNLAFFTHGASVIYPSSSYSPSHIVDTLVSERCTALHGVPTHFLGILDEITKRKQQGHDTSLSELRTGIAAGSPIPIELMRRLIEEMNLTELTNAYGMTETSPVSFQTNPSDTLLQRTSTVGKVHPHVRAKLVDPVSGEIVQRGKPGEVCIAGYLVQKGYWNDPVQTSLVMHTQKSFLISSSPAENGDPNMDADPETIWMRTGDMGIMDENGYLRIISRIKDIIIRGGENLFPIQIEDRLTFHPCIHEAAVVAVPDPKWGEVVGVWIVRSSRDKEHALNGKEVKKWIMAEMNPQNAPSYVWFLGDDGVPKELPKTASGKVQKHILRDWAQMLKEGGIGIV